MSTVYICMNCNKHQTTDPEELCHPCEVMFEAAHSGFQEWEDTEADEMVGLHDEELQILQPEMTDQEIAQLRQQISAEAGKTGEQRAWEWFNQQ